MTTNRLAKSTVSTELQLTAADLASIARENGDGKKAQAWQKVADERGEGQVPDHLRVSFDTSKQKIYVAACR